MAEPWDNTRTTDGSGNNAFYAQPPLQCPANDYGYGSLPTLSLDYDPTRLNVDGSERLTVVPTGYVNPLHEASNTVSIKYDTTLQVNPDGSIGVVEMNYSLPLEHNGSNVDLLHDTTLQVDADGKLGVVFPGVEAYEAPLHEQDGAVTLLHNTTLTVDGQGQLGVVFPPAPPSTTFVAPLLDSQNAVTLTHDTSLKINDDGTLGVSMQDVAQTITDTIRYAPPLLLGASTVLDAQGHPLPEVQLQHDAPLTVTADTGHLVLATGKGLELDDQGQLAVKVDSMLEGKGPIQIYDDYLSMVSDFGVGTLLDWGLNSNADFTTSVVGIKYDPDFTGKGGKLGLESPGYRRIPYFQLERGFTTDSTFIYNDTFSRVEAQNIMVDKNFEPSDDGYVPTFAYVNQVYQAKEQGGAIDVGALTNGRRELSVRVDNATIKVNDSNIMGCDYAPADGSAMSVDNVEGKLDVQVDNVTIGVVGNKLVGKYEGDGEYIKVEENMITFTPLIPGANIEIVTTPEGITINAIMEAVTTTDDNEEMVTNTDDVIAVVDPVTTNPVITQGPNPNPAPDPSVPIVPPPPPPPPPVFVVSGGGGQSNPVTDPVPIPVLPGPPPPPYFGIIPIGWARTYGNKPTPKEVVDDKGQPVLDTNGHPTYQTDPTTGQYIYAVPPQNGGWSLDTGTCLRLMFDTPVCWKGFANEFPHQAVNLDILSKYHVQLVLPALNTALLNWHDSYVNLKGLPDLTVFALKSDLPASQDLSAYALKTDIPAAQDLSPYLTSANAATTYQPLHTNLTGLSNASPFLPAFTANGSIVPGTATYDLGSLTKQWETIYVTNANVQGQLNCTNFSIIGGIAGNILPAGNGTYTVGNASVRYSTVFAQNVDLTGNVTAANVKALAGLDTLDYNSSYLVNKPTLPAALTAGTGITITSNAINVNASQTQITTLGPLTGLNVNGTVTSHLIPTNDNVYTLGTSANRWAFAYVRSFDISGSITGTLVPVVNASQDLGSSTYAWRNLYLSGPVAASNIKALASLDTLDYNSTYLINKPTLPAALTAGTGITITSNAINVNAAQTQITSVGTLSSLTVSGGSTLGNITPTAPTTYSIGATANRFANVYAVTVDGTTGTFVNATVSGGGNNFTVKTTTATANACTVYTNDVTKSGYIGIGGSASTQTLYRNNLVYESPYNHVFTCNNVSTTAVLTLMPTAATFSQNLTAPNIKALAGLDTLDYTSTYLINKPSLGTLAAQNSVDWNSATDIANKPPLTTTTSRNVVQTHPPAALTTNTATTIAWNGYPTSFTYTVSNSSGSNAYQAFDKTYGTSRWMSGAACYQQGNGTYRLSVSTAGVLGEWVQIQIAPAIVVASFDLVVNTVAYSARQFNLCGSTDGTNWVNLGGYTGPGAAGTSTFANGNTTPYSYYRFVIQNIYGDGQGSTNGTGAELCEWVLRTPVFNSTRLDYALFNDPMVNDLLEFNNGHGYGPPTLNTRSPGTRMVLWNGLSSTLTDHAIGVENGGLWSGVLGLDQHFTWYAGTTRLAQMNANGAFDIVLSDSFGCIRVAPAVGSNGASSIGFHVSNTFTPSAAGDAWGLGRNVWGTGAGFGIGNNNLGLILSVDATAGALNTRTIQPAADNAYALGASGNRWTAIYAMTTTISTSDENAKENIVELGDAEGLDLIDALKPISYQFVDGPDTKKRFGLGARATHDTLQKLGHTDLALVDTSGEVWGMAYSELIAPLIKSVQQLSTRVVELEGQVERLQTVAVNEKAV